MVARLLGTVHWKLGWLPIAVSVVIVGLGFLPESLRASWYFTPEKYQQGHWWLAFTSQWVHLNTFHTFSNVLGLVLLSALLLGESSPWQFALCVSSCLLFIAAFLLLFPNTYGYYAGFSGVLYGLFFFASVCSWGRDKLLTIMGVAAIAAKIVWDLFGPSAHQQVAWLGARVAVEAHIAGVAGAALASVLCMLTNRGSTSE